MHEYDVLGKYEEVINKIYDDFESRTCGNCAVGGYYCKISNILADSGKIHLVDFGCNKYEPKNEITFVTSGNSDIDVKMEWKEIGEDAN